MTIVERECTVEVAMRWVEGYETSVVLCEYDSYTRGGTHLAGLERAMTRAINDSLLPGTKKLSKLAKSGNDRASKEDVQEGLIAGLKVTFPNPSFVAKQSKSSERRPFKASYTKSKAEPLGLV